MKNIRNGIKSTSTWLNIKTKNKNSSLYLINCRILDIDPLSIIICKILFIIYKIPKLFDSSQKKFLKIKLTKKKKGYEKSK